MSTVATRWTEWSERFAALTQRERAIVAFAVVIGGAFLIFNFTIDPALQKARTATRVAAAANAELAQQQAMAAMLKAQNADPDSGNRQRLAQARQQLIAAGERLSRFEAGMVPPARMQAFLEGLLARKRSIELLGLRTLPVTLVGAPAKEEAVPATSAAQSATVAAAEPTAPATGDGIYQHGIEIRLAGSYNDLLNYLAELERMPQRVMWNSVSLTVEKHPRNIMILRVYTLSLDRNWLSV
jgi:MSHA biogenesis protein MshJ